jgi:quinohemoprotein amine dehydrogenase
MPSFDGFARGARTHACRVETRLDTLGEGKRAACTSATLVFLLFFAAIASAQSSSPEQGIPVTDPLVIAKCGTCHARDGHGNMQRISWERTTPEGWQEALKRMILVNGVSLTPQEARSIVKYLASSHGLAPEEAKAISYYAERRIHPETGIPENLQHACARCHTFARALSWRRSLDDWKQLAADHAARYKLPPNEEAVASLAKAAPLHTPEWDAWTASARAQNPAGRWLLTASLPGRGQYYGDVQVDATGDGDFSTSVRLTSVNDGSRMIRSGRAVVYGGYAWRGRSQGPPVETSTTNGAGSEAREVLWIAPDQSSAEGRWFWGQYQEFGFDVHLRRAPANSAAPTLLTVGRPSLKAGSESTRIRLFGDQLPANVKAVDLDLGPGVAVRRIVSATTSEIVAEVDVAFDAPPGKHDVRLSNSVLPGAIAIYDRVDYIKIAPDSAMAAFGDDTHAPGYQQFEAIGYQRGRDGKVHTADDVELGPLDPNDVTWSLEVFYSTPGGNTDFVGKIAPSGFFTPAAANPKANFDVWVVATSKTLTNISGKPLLGKSYMVVTVPEYTLNGRRYVRDLDRWVDNGPDNGPDKGPAQ